MPPLFPFGDMPPLGGPLQPKHRKRKDAIAAVGANDGDDEIGGGNDDDDESAKRAPAAIAFVSGAAAGLADTVVNYPPYCLHYRKQLGQVLSPRANPRIYWPRELYRGVGAYACIVPVTCISDGATHYLRDAHAVGPFASSFASGMLAALVVQAPTSNVIVAQNDHSLSARAAIRRLWRADGARRFYTGLAPMLGREGLYASAVFWGEGEAAARYPAAHARTHGVSSAALSGSVATALSQPLDTLATAMQRTASRSVAASARAMYAEGGLARFYYGVAYRGYAIVAGVFVMQHVSAATKNALS